MRTVSIESPFAENILRNVCYAQRALKDCLARGEAPYASHLLYPFVLDDHLPRERKQGINAGLSISIQLDATVVYIDYGISSGMQAGINWAQIHGKTIEYRTIGANPGPGPSPGPGLGQ